MPSLAMSETLIQVKERPMLFSGPMIRSLLNGSKTQTRRMIKNQPEGNGVEIMHSGTSFPAYGLSDWISEKYQGYGFQTDDEIWRCPYGQPGDRLWVRETWGTDSSLNGLPPNALFSVEGGSPVYYRADDKQPEKLDTWRPSIHMPRAASRLLLELTAVRVERLQDISEADAVTEGVEQNQDGSWHDYADPSRLWQDDAKASFISLWFKINGAPSWAANPWVWVVEFKVIAGGKEVASA